MNPNTQRIADDVWQSGYCDATVRKSIGPMDRIHRLVWLSEHVKDCAQCRKASTAKSLEARVAERLGQLKLFEAAGDVSKLPGFSEAFAAVMQSAAREGIATRGLLAWMARTAAERRGQPWPGRTSVEPPGES